MLCISNVYSFHSIVIIRNAKSTKVKYYLLHWAISVGINSFTDGFNFKCSLLDIFYSIIH